MAQSRPIILKHSMSQGDSPEARTEIGFAVCVRCLLGINICSNKEKETGLGKEKSKHCNISAAKLGQLGGTL